MAGEIERKKPASGGTLLPPPPTPHTHFFLVSVSPLLWLSQCRARSAACLQMQLESRLGNESCGEGREGKRECQALIADAII